MSGWETTRDPEDLVRVRIRELRKGRGWSLAQLAKHLAELGMPWHLATVSKVENGPRSISLNEALVMAAAFEVAPSSLLAPEDENEMVALGELEVRAADLHAWVSGDRPLPGRDASVFFESLAGRPSEQERAAAQARALLTRMREVRDEAQRLIGELEQVAGEAIGKAEGSE